MSAPTAISGTLTLTEILSAIVRIVIASWFPATVKGGTALFLEDPVLQNLIRPVPKCSISRLQKKVLLLAGFTV